MLDLSIRKHYTGFRLELEARSSARVLGVVGPSGSGKSTLLKCLAGVTRPDAGKIVVDGQTFSDTSAGMAPVSPRRRRIAYVPQDGLLFPHLTVRGNLRYGLGAHGPGPDFEDVVGVLELEPLLDRAPPTLSGGEVRRAALGRALLSGPRLMLLDEPLAGLDRASAGRTLRFLKTVLDRFAVRAVYVSHSISEVVFLCDDAWVIEQGQLVARGRPRDVVARFIADQSLDDDLCNLFSVDRDETAPKDVSRYRLADQSLITLRTDPGVSATALISIRASDILLSRTRPERISARNVLRGTITRLDERSGRVLAFVDVGMEWMVWLTPGAVKELELASGVEVFAIVKASSIELLHAP